MLRRYIALVAIKRESKTGENFLKVSFLGGEAIDWDISNPCEIQLNKIWQEEAKSNLGLL
jgi:hypothetical protein